MTVVSFCMSALRKLAIALTALALATGVTLATAASASASAILTVDDNATVLGYPYGVLMVSGTATCSTASGTATISVSAIQIVMNQANGAGTTTITCATQPVRWTATLGPSNANCNLIGGIRPSYCFRTDSVATVFGNLTRGGVQEATVIKPVHT